MANYQIMEESQKTADGKYMPDYQKLIDAAETQEEKDYIKQVSGYKWNTFVFNMVSVTKQACGHYEIFQHPMNAYHNLEETLRLDEEHAKSSKCTHCICSFK